MKTLIASVAVLALSSLAQAAPRPSMVAKIKSAVEAKYDTKVPLTVAKEKGAGMYLVQGPRTPGLPGVFAADVKVSHGIVDSVQLRMEAQ